MYLFQTISSLKYDWWQKDKEEHLRVKNQLQVGWHSSTLHVCTVADKHTTVLMINCSEQLVVILGIPTSINTCTKLYTYVLLKQGEQTQHHSQIAEWDFPPLM